LSVGKPLFPDISREEGVNYRGALPHEQVLEEFRRAHAYVMPSRYETFGLSYVEGLAHGCVVIARDFEPQREMLDYGRSGLLVNPFSVDDIYAAMSRVVEMNNRERLDWAMRGYEKFLRAYSFETVSRQWYDVFHEIGMRSKENK
jgi:glycosyltransferase involved in cell wall biosynthesis